VEAAARLTVKNGDPPYGIMEVPSLEDHARRLQFAHFQGHKLPSRMTVLIKRAWMLRVSGATSITRYSNRDLVKEL
jgi:hypothetical protein